MTGREKILEALQASGKPLTQTELIIATKMPSGSVGAFLSTMSMKGDIFRRANPLGRGSLYWDRPFETDLVDKRVDTTPTRAALPGQKFTDAAESEGAERSREDIERFSHEYAERMKALGRRDLGWPDSYRPDIVTREGSRAEERNSFRDLANSAVAPVAVGLPRIEIAAYPPRNLVIPDSMRKVSRETVVATRETFEEIQRPTGPNRIPFPIPGKGQAVLEVPHDIDADDVEMLMVMLEAYGARAFGRRAAA